MNPFLLLMATAAIAESHDRAARTARGEERPRTPGEPDFLIIDSDKSIIAFDQKTVGAALGTQSGDADMLRRLREEAARLNPPLNREARRHSLYEKPHRHYACPSCNTKADTPKRCRECNVKMSRVR